MRLSSQNLGILTLYSFLKLSETEKVTVNFFKKSLNMRKQFQKFPQLLFENIEAV